MVSKGKERKNNKTSQQNILRVLICGTEEAKISKEKNDNGARSRDSRGADIYRREGKKNRQVIYIPRDVSTK